MSFKWKVSRLIAYIVFRLLFGFEIKGARNVPKRGGVILCPNHRSSWDPPFIGVASPREVFFLAKEELFRVNRLFSWLIRNYNALSLKRGAGGYGALKISLDLLKNEKAVVIFPEGTRNRTKRLLLPLKKGAALLAQKGGFLMVPAFIKNSNKKLIAWLTRRASPGVYFGKPLDPKKYPSGKEGIEMMTRDLERALIELSQERRIE
jgi:1-acyl-sn-glycerol-3-phosphate acyltransferase